MAYVPPNNPLLSGERWKQYHYAMGPTLATIPDISWKYVLEEKSRDMIHVLQFPYNGEPPRVRRTIRIDDCTTARAGLTKHVSIEPTGGEPHHFQC